MNEAKSRVVDLTQGEAFGFLGFTFAGSARRGAVVGAADAGHEAADGVAAEAAGRCSGAGDSQPVGRVIAVINPILRGWVNYFRIGNAARCFSFVKAWVEKKVRRHLMRARGRRGFGWKRWSTAWLYTTLGVCSTTTGCIPGAVLKARPAR